MANHKTRISTKAAPGDRKRKKKADHPTLSSNCSRKSRMGADASPALRQTNQAATAMARNKIVQTGANSQLGGVQAGFLSSAYQGRRDGVVSKDPRSAAARQAAMQTMSRMNEW